MPLIAIVGGPGAGKSTVLDLVSRELGDRVAVVPEAATMLFKGGFPRPDNAAGLRAAQTAIFHVQRGLETIALESHPNRIILTDRGTVDGAAYWPGAERDFFEQMNGRAHRGGTSLEHELARYAGIVFLESAAVGGLAIDTGNDIRTEGLERACTLDARLRTLWEHHPNFRFVPHSTSFLDKVQRACAAVIELADGLRPPRREPVLRQAM